MRRIALAVLVLTASPVLAHEGSWYPYECCHDMDCKPVPCTDLSDEDRGAVSYSPRPGALYVFEKMRVKPSQDNQCHVCIHDGTPLCVFVQQGS